MKRIGMIYIRLQTLLIAITLIGFGVSELRELHSFLAIAKTTEGIVVGYKRSDRKGSVRKSSTTHSTNEYFYARVIAFRDSNHRVHHVLSDASGTEIPTVGERVTVRYDPTDPGRFMTDLGIRCSAIIFSFAFGLFCFGVLLAMDWGQYRTWLAKLSNQTSPAPTGR
ncbi:MAG: DUF3592 domain-containing protein [Gammaproteobacteria bacterium]|nr:MAG: DUF3592 domain-containing protein [Gammaproteobacteria bacterium]